MPVVTLPVMDIDVTAYARATALWRSAIAWEMLTRPYWIKLLKHLSITQTHHPCILEYSLKMEFSDWSE